MRCYPCEKVLVSCIPGCFSFIFDECLLNETKLPFVKPRLAFFHGAVPFFEDFRFPGFPLFCPEGKSVLCRRDIVEMLLLQQQPVLLPSCPLSPRQLWHTGRLQARRSSVNTAICAQQQPWKVKTPAPARCVSRLLCFDH